MKNQSKLLAVALVVIALAVSGCALPASGVPDGYVGPKAVVVDTFVSYDRSKADFFVLEEVDGVRIKSSIVANHQENAGRGFFMIPKVITHDIPAHPIKLVLVGRTEYAAPVQALTHTVYQIKGTVEFTPVDGKRYAVRGNLSEEASAVWIEDMDSGAIMGTKIEHSGSTALGVLEK